MERTLGGYAARFFTQCAPMDKSGIPVASVHARMGQDLQLLRDVFERWLQSDPRRLARVQPAFQPLIDLHDLIGAASEEEFVTAWRIMLANAPHTGIGIVDAMLRLRTDFQQKQRDALLGECKRVWEEAKGNKRKRNLLVKGLVKGIEAVEDAADAVNATTRAMLGALNELAMKGGKKMAGAVKLTVEGFTEFGDLTRDFVKDKIGISTHK